jgi:hypothetical protein
MALNLELVVCRHPSRFARSYRIRARGQRPLAMRDRLPITFTPDDETLESVTDPSARQGPYVLVLQTVMPPVLVELGRERGLQDLIRATSSNFSLRSALISSRSSDVGRSGRRPPSAPACVPACAASRDGSQYPPRHDAGAGRTRSPTPDTNGVSAGLTAGGAACLTSDRELPLRRLRLPPLGACADRWPMRNQHYRIRAGRRRLSASGTQHATVRVAPSPGCAVDPVRRLRRLGRPCPGSPAPSHGHCRSLWSVPRSAAGR